MKTQHFLAGLITIFLLSGYVLGQTDGWTDDGTVVRLTINGDSVGIGTYSPEAKLDVRGYVQFKSTGELDFDNAGSSGYWNLKAYKHIGFESNKNGNYSPTDAHLDFFSNGTHLMRIRGDGNVGIGTVSFTSKDRLKVAADNGYVTINTGLAGVMRLTLNPSGADKVGELYFRSADATGSRGSQILVGQGSYFKIKDTGGRVLFYSPGYSGNVGIGTTTIPSGYKLAVDGKIIAEEVQVEMSGSWPDHVFADDYRLRPLREVADYIKANRHLPDMPSAVEVSKNGVSLGKMQATLLQKVEELTLYVIDLKKENEALKERVAQLEK